MSQAGESRRELPASPVLQAQFLQWMRMQNCTPRTIEQWTFTLDRFRAWCSQRGIDSVAEVTPEVLAAYRRYLFHYRNPKTNQPLKFATQATTPRSAPIPRPDSPRLAAMFRSWLQ